MSIGGRATLLFVVDRKETGRYEYLCKAFASDDRVAVILDRRHGERRGSRTRIPNDRRRSERRIRENHHELARLGYAVQIFTVSHWSSTSSLVSATVSSPLMRTA